MDDFIKQLQEQNKLYQKILRKIPAFLAYKNLEGTYEVVSEDVDDLYSDRFDTIAGKKVEDVYSEVARKDVERLDQEVLKSNQTETNIFEAETDEGTISLDSTRTVIYDDSGNPMGILSVSRDISDLVELTDKLEQLIILQNTVIEIAKSFVDLNYFNFDILMEDSLRKLGTALEADRAYVFTYSFHDNIMNNTHEWVNEGITAEINNLQDIPITDFLDGWVNKHREKEYVVIDDIEDLDKHSPIYKILSPQGIKSLITIPIFIENECYGFFGFDGVKSKHNWTKIMDSIQIVPELYASVISQNMMLLELEKARREATDASNIQKDFIAKVTHELRTPINGVANALYLLKDSNLDIDQTHYTEVIEYSLDTLTSMVNNILDYSKIEKDKLIFKSSNINLENELIKIMKVHKYMANNKGLGLYLNYDYNIPTIIVADIEKIRQIINNLIVNAIKYTNYGNVELKVSLTNLQTPYADIKFEIIDTGIGISKDAQRHIFDEFYQVGDVLNKQPQGTGLGLTITKDFVQFLKGTLQVESQERQGSNFNFELKFYTPIKEKRQALDKKGLLVNLSEGNHSNLEGFLQHHFREIEVISLNQLRLKIREPFDSIFIYTNNATTYPAHMEKIDVILEKLGSKCKKVLLYDDVKRQEYVDTFDLYDCHLEVPLESEILIEKLTMCGEVDMSKGGNNHIPQRKHKILLVDDNNINRRVMGQLLKGMDLEVVEAVDGFDAIEKVKQQFFSMIFMDILMPGMDGYETSRRIRELDGVSGSIPIIAVTANDEQSTKEKMVEYGMNGVLTKPLKKEDLNKLLNEYFQASENEVQSINEDIVIFDQDEFELFYDEPFLRQEIINAFFEERVSDLKRIDDAFRSEDCDQLYKALHYLKGSFSYLKAKRLLKMSQHIMELANNNKLQDILLLEDQLLKNYSLLINELNEYYETI